MINRTEKGGCEIFNWYEEKNLKYFNFYDQNQTREIFLGARNYDEYNDYSLQIINIQIINFLSQLNYTGTENEYNIFFSSQSRKGDFFILSFIETKLEETKIDFLLKIETHMESFCKYLFLENSLINHIYSYTEESDGLNKDKKYNFYFMLLTPTEKENKMNIYSLMLNFLDSSQKGIICSTQNSIIENKIFDIQQNGILQKEESKNDFSKIEKLLENRDGLIIDFEESQNEEIDKNKIESGEFYPENGSISCMEKSLDENFIVIGIESLRIFVCENQINQTKSKLMNSSIKILTSLLLQDLENHKINLPANKTTQNTNNNYNTLINGINSIISIKILPNEIKQVQNIDNQNTENSKNFKIIIGMYSTNIVVLNFDFINLKLEKICEINNSCLNKKPGISYIDSIIFGMKIFEEYFKEIKLEDLNLETDFESNKSDIKKVHFICTGSYDYHIRIYEFKENNKFEFLGSLYNGSNNIIHKLKFFTSEILTNDNLLLFVASDQKFFNIYNLA